MGKLLMIKTQGGILAPADDEAIETLTKVKNGDMVIIEYKKKRNPKFHRKAFAFLNMVLQNQDVYKDLESLRREFLLKSGSYEIHITTKGIPIYIPKSMAFDEMDEIEFGELYSKFIDIALQHFLTHMTMDEIEKEVVNFM